MSNLIKLMEKMEVGTSSFLPTKKEIQKSSKEFAKDLIDSGNHNPIELLSQAVRLKEAFTAIEKELRDSLPQEDFKAFGMDATYRNGGNIIQYEEDEIYSNIKKDLYERKELLKSALKQSNPIYDPYGNEIPKVSTKPRKSSLTIKF